MDVGLFAVAIAAALVAMLVVERFAWRRVQAGQGRYVWLSNVVLLVLPLSLLSGSIVLFARQPWLAALAAAWGVVWLILVTRHFHRLSRAVTSTPPGSDPSSATYGQRGDFGCLLWATGMLFYLAIVIAMAIAQAGR